MDYISLIKCDNSFTGLKKEQVLKNQKNKMLSEERRKLQRSLMLRKKKIKFRRVCVYIKYMFIDIYEYLLEIRWKSLEENLQRGKEF